MDTAAIRSEWIGRVVDEKFPLLAWLGGSGHSAVYLTELDGDRSRKAAIKLVQVDGEDADACIMSWTIAKRLAHPHLVRVLHSGRCQIDGQALVYVVSEYADEVLSEILRERALTSDETQEMLGPVLDALQFLHGSGFVHGQLKASNILVVEDQLKLSSDSIQAANSPARQSEPGNTFEAPELAAQRVSYTADIWSLGATLVEALTQRLPAWDGSTQRDPDVPQSIPQPLADVARECLRSDPTRRCTIARIRALLQPGATQPVAEIVEPPPRAQIEAKPPARPASTPQSGPLPVASSAEPSEPASGFRKAALIVVVLLALVLIAFAALRSHWQTPPIADKADQTPVAASAPPAKPQAGHQAAVEPTTAATPQADAAPQAPPAAQSAVVPQATSTPTTAGGGAVAQRVMPDIPAKATATIQGKVQVEIQVAVDASGVVSNAEIVSDGHGRYFAKLALEAVRQWRFTPPEADGHAVPSAWTLHFVFRQTGAEVTPVQTAP